MESKKYIIDLFIKNVKGIEVCLESYSKKHYGKEGHWLEKLMGIKHNSKNLPDIMGYEMKKDSSSKTTLGDYSASEYAFSSKREVINKYNDWTDDIKITRSEFIRYFGNKNPKKHNRYSWSGKCVPTYNTWNDFGQTLLVEDSNIVIYYSSEYDKRQIELPEYITTKKILIAYWDSNKLRKSINEKFNNAGFFICKKIDNKYEKICFGKPFSYDYFLECIKNKKIIFDSGMYDGNTRNYSKFRGSEFWNELITEEY